jgi:purine-binding chemotaxis protein CheW
MNNKDLLSGISERKDIRDLADVTVPEEGEENESDAQISDDKVVQVVSFTLSNEVEYGINILSIHEIQRMLNISRLPNTPDYILGLMNLRGNVIPVIDIRKRFGYTESEHTVDTRIVVVEIGTRRVGLLVDKVYQVFRIPLKDISSPTEMIDGVSAEFISGVGRIKNKLIIILKLENILFSDSSDEDKS